MNDFFTQLGAFAPVLYSAVKALIFFVVGYIIASWVSRTIRRRVLKNPQLDDTLGSFFASIAKWLILAVVIIAILQLFGFQATSLVAVLGAATLAIGLALQGTLADIAAGVMLIVFRPFKLGQYIDIGGTAGTIKDLNLFITELVTPDNVQIVMPNGKVWGSIITNFRRTISGASMLPLVSTMVMMRTRPWPLSSNGLQTTSGRRVIRNPGFALSI